MDPEIEWSRASSFRVAVGAILILWSLVIGPEQPGNPFQRKPDTTNPSKSYTSGEAPPLKQSKIASRPAATIDREAFLASYKRQARVMLDACLQSWQPSPARATFTAVMQKKSGRLMKLEALGEGATLPGCVAELTGMMDFTAVTETMTGENIVMQWTAEW